MSALTGETVITPLMVYAYHPDGFNTDPTHDQADLSELAPNVSEATRTKIELKTAAGIPATKSLDVSKDDWSALTPDRQAALDMTQEMVGLVGVPRIYTLGQTAVMNSSIERGYQGQLWGSDLRVRVEEGLTQNADTIGATLLDRYATTAEDAGRERFVKMPGFSRTVQVTGYEFNGFGDAERVFIRDTPACEMYMGSIALDQLLYAPNVVRIVPWYMYDREVAAMRVVGDFYTPQDHENITSVIMNPSGDIKKMMGWFGRSDATLLDALAHRRTSSKVAALTEEFSTDRARMYAKDFRDVFFKVSPKGMMSPNRQSDATISEKMRDFLAFPFISYPLFETHIKSADKVQSAVDQLSALSFSLSGTVLQPHDSDVTFEDFPGKNTNHVMYLRIPIAKLNEKDQTASVIVHGFFESTNRGHIDFVQALQLTKNPQERLANLQEFMSSTASGTRYILAEASRK